MTRLWAGNAHAVVLASPQTHTPHTLLPALPPPPPPCQVVVFDKVSEDSVLGPTYLPVWQKVFSPRQPPILLSKLVAQATAQHGGKLPPGAALCLRGEM